MIIASSCENIDTNITLTGWARARARRHPITKATFSMVTVITPVERKIKARSDALSCSKRWVALTLSDLLLYTGVARRHVGKLQ